jgi:hypothetical protein
MAGDAGQACRKARGTRDRADDSDRQLQAPRGYRGAINVT